MALPPIASLGIWTSGAGGQRLMPEPTSAAVDILAVAPRRSSALAGQPLPAAQGLSGGEGLAGAQRPFELPVLDRHGPIRLKARTSGVGGEGFEPSVSSQTQPKQLLLAVTLAKGLHLEGRQGPLPGRRGVLGRLGSSRPWHEPCQSGNRQERPDGPGSQT